MRVSMALMTLSALCLTACAAQTPEQQLARLDAASLAHSDGYVTGSRIRQDDLSQYDPALMVIGPNKVNTAPDNQATSALSHSMAYPFIQFGSR